MSGVERQSSVAQALLHLRQHSPRKQESVTCSETTGKGRERSPLQLLAVTYNFIGDSRRDRLKTL